MYAFYNKIGDTSISVALKPGLYSMGLDSGTGKTYLANWINKVRAGDKSMLAYDYLDEAKGMNLNTFWNGISDEEKEEELVLIVLDRFDMYGEKYIETVNEMAKDFIVLADCKVNLDKLPFDYCEIELGYDKEHKLYRIEVW